MSHKPRKHKVASNKAALFAAGKVRGLSDTRAAREAGFSETYARQATKRISSQPAVKALVDTGRKELMERATVTSLSIIEDTRKAIEFAYSVKNSMAVIKGLSLIAEVSGLLVTKIEVKTTVDIGSAITDAKQRAARVVNSLILPAPVEEPRSSILDHHTQDHGFVDPFGD